MPELVTEEEIQKFEQLCQDIEQAMPEFDARIVVLMRPMDGNKDANLCRLHGEIRRLAASLVALLTQEPDLMKELYNQILLKSQQQRKGEEC